MPNQVLTHMQLKYRNSYMWITGQVKIYTKKLDSDMYRTCHEPMLASMGMQKAILYNICGI